MAVKKVNAVLKDYIVEVLNDYHIASESRQVSLLGRKEALTGKAKFGIFGDGKEIPQLAMAKVFRNGDWRAGYYRDQTFMFASGLMTLEEFFAQLYGDTNEKFNPQTAGRLMNNHFATKTIDKNSNSFLLPALILQPIIENAVKYGAYESIDESKIIVQSRIWDNLLEVKVCNEFDPDFLQVFNMPFGNVQMKFSLAHQDDLFQFFGIHQDQGRIHFIHFTANTAKLFIITLVFCLHRRSEFGFRILNGFNDVICIFNRVQGIICKCIFQFDGCSDITGNHFLNFFTVFTIGDENL